MPAAMVAAVGNTSRVGNGVAMEREDAVSGSVVPHLRFAELDGDPLRKPTISPVRRGQVQPVKRNLIDPHWVLMAPIIGAAALVNGIATLTVPHVFAMASWVIALAITASTPWLIRFDLAREFSATRHNLLATFVVALPMFLLGLSIAQWTATMRAHWSDAIGTLVIIGAMASLILKRRAPSIITAQIALWTGVALVAGNRGIWFALTVGTAIGLYTSIRQVAPTSAKRAASANVNTISCEPRKSSATLNRPGRVGSGKRTGAACWSMFRRPSATC